MQFLERLLLLFPQYTVYRELMHTFALKKSNNILQKMLSTSLIFFFYFQNTAHICHQEVNSYISLKHNFRF